MSYFRSETMSYYQIVVPRESAWDVYNELGKIEAIETVDMTPEEPLITRPFYPMIRRCDEVLSKLQTFETQMLKYRIKNLQTANISGFLQTLPDYSAEQEIPDDRWFQTIEHKLEERYNQLNEQLKNMDSLTSRQNQLFEYKAVLLKSKEVLGSQHFSSAKNGAINPTGALGADEPAFQSIKSFALSYLVGVVNKDDSMRFKRIMFRATKGNSWIVMSDIEYSKHDIELIDPLLEEGGQSEKKGEDVNNPRSVFIVVYQGGANEFLKQKLNRICDSFGANKYLLPEDPTQLMKKAMDTDNELNESKNLYNLTLTSLKTILLHYAQIQKTLGCSLLEMSKLIMLREKAIYHNLNCLHLKHSIYTGFFWCPSTREGEVHQCLQALGRRRQNVAPAQIIELNPPDNVLTPTYFKINDFTWAFQEIVNTYGIPRYKEINPGLFACIFFPFMFGIMFGDIGHGGFLLLAGIWLVKNNETLKKSTNAYIEGVAQARYLFLLMGICAFYCGFIYNDFMSLPWNIFGSCFKNVHESLETTHIKGCIYPIGFDPKWYIATNELNFFNSFKMKFSVIFGVTQMSFGILLKGSNTVYFRNWVDFFCEFVPQMIFLLSTFGYMCLLIFFKWTQDWEGRTEQAPSIINTMINIPLKGGLTDNQPLYDQATQESIQAKILVIAFICVPWMLIPKPLILLYQNGASPQTKETKALQPKSEIKTPLLEQSKEQVKGSKLADELRRSLVKKQLEKIERQRLKDIQREKDVSPEEFELLGDEIVVGDHPKVSSPKIKTHDEPHKPTGGHGGGHGHGEFEFGEIFVHQIIETIEFVLGSISNTASYLRLWALSLAHGQLAKVFFSKCIGAGIEDGSFLTIFIGWPVFLHCTIGVLMMMDVMECFLHALRLQWVEFQNKFYKADGVKFAPMSFISSIKQSQGTS